MYTPIASTLGFILSPDGKNVLMVHRIGRGDDENFGKYNGLGGKLERDEDVLSGMRREIREEAGLECDELTLRGTINWTNFGPHGEDWLAFVFLVTRFRGTPPERNEEGPLEWVPLERVPELPMWEGDRLFLSLVFDDDPRPFHGHMPYDGVRPVGWTWHR